MKVILIKDSQYGKANTIVEVSPGYGTNFLVAKGFGVPYNEKTKRELDKRLSALTANEMEIRSQAIELKEKLEKEKLVYSLDALIDAHGNLIVHKSISTKDVLKDLSKKGYKLDKYAVQKVHLVSNGIHEVDIIVYNDIVAKLQIEVKVNVK
ncbi:50S ribosomal protein L9 [Mycoplasmopsis californica HAZ160_1]|uniref:Large ribosomal subunit protein bL9 n=2 Tax=Mycoplasmopsis californica TaxID=2113 RepID=A0A059XVT3_9BACT|nr:50S ribosomal protein L9 [Mycoplasmopsis californica]AIA29337.1 50S ribosomal protein L9 [Mycoplasmopsis californica]BAP01206.1 50S ribosomal protein L9 [Mycoplasmopsis californica HAZ160_1]BBG41077.1 50S ribosomal protein L9 [Mycoplasmopsis californica]BBG41670.1 50S ribosomal protein L9 [Mycoplasmopsis californica]BBG42264.1 50S ribosomal protein L9 [Mycoplasmopsis californica]